MKERQRWKSEEDALLLSYVRQYGPREWGLVAQRMNAPFFRRDAKSCLERWKNYLRPGIKKGSLTEEEQRLVIRLQAKHGNKWKKIAAEVPGRTAKRLGKWWEVFKERRQREESRERGGTGVAAAGAAGGGGKVGVAGPIDQGKYDQLLESFAEKLAKEQRIVGLTTHPHPPAPTLPPPPPHIMTTPLIPPWLANSNANVVAPPCAIRPPPSPSVTLTLSSSTTTAPASSALGLSSSSYSSWLQPTAERGPPGVVTDGSSPMGLPTSAQNNGIPSAFDSSLLSELNDCCRELEEGHQAWLTHKKEATWMLRRVELQLESEKARKKKEKLDEIEAKIRALREEEKAALERIEAEYRDQLLGLRRDAEAKEQKLVEQWSTKHMLLAKFLEQIGGGRQ